MNSAGDFDWFSDPSIVCRSQESIAAYRNRDGQVEIRQRRAWDEEQDTIIYANPAQLPDLIRALVTLHDDVEAAGGNPGSQAQGETR